VAASFGGAAIFCLVVLGPKLLRSAGVGWASALMLPWWWETFLVMGLTTALWVAVALLTKPDPERVLDEFYRRARPLGSWGPVRARVAAADAARPSAEQGDSDGGPAGWPEPSSRGGGIMNTGWRPVAIGFAIAGLGAGATALYIVGMSWLYIGHSSSGALALAGALLGAFAFKRSLGPYLDALEAPPDAEPAGDGPGGGGNGKADGEMDIHA
jgi:SSS family solute:Na+ symporter